MDLIRCTSMNPSPFHTPKPEFCPSSLVQHNGNSITSNGPLNASLLYHKIGQIQNHSEYATLNRCNATSAMANDLQDMPSDDEEQQNEQLASSQKRKRERNDAKDDTTTENGQRRHLR